MTVTTRSHRDNWLTPALEHATVADAMHPGIVSCPLDASATKVARVMATHRIHCVFVMHPAQNESGQPYVWGVISDLDLLEAAFDGTGAATAGSLAARPIITVKPTMPLTDASRLMVERGVNHLVVLHPSSRQPVGVLSTIDIADVLAWGEA